MLKDKVLIKYNFLVIDVFSSTEIVINECT